MKILKRRKIRIRPYHHNMVSSLNFIDKDVQALLLPLNLMQNILGYPKYRIVNNVITPNSRFISLLSLCVTLLSISLFFYRSFHRIYTGKINSNLAAASTSSLITDFVIPSFGVIITFWSCFFQSDCNILFVLKFLGIHRLLNDKGASKRFIVCNWIIFFSIFIYSILFIAIVNIQFRLPLYNVVCGFAAVCFDTDIIYAIRIIMLLKDKVVLWNSQVKNIRNMEDSDKEYYCQTFFQTYIDILECYDIYRICFQQQVNIILWLISSFGVLLFILFFLFYFFFRSYFTMYILYA